MKKIFTILSVAAGVAVSAQKTYPAFIVDGALSSSAAMYKIDPNEIESISVYKSANNLPEKIRQFAPFTKEGIVDITLKHSSKSEVVSASSLNISNHLAENNEIIINNLKLNPENIKIFKEAIESQNIINENDNKYLSLSTK